MSSETDKDKDAFVLMIRGKAEEAVQRIKELEHKKRGLEMQAERTRLYINQLNDFIQEHGNLI